MKIAIAGKGGTGKTTIAAWLSNYLAERGKNVWLIDADTALSLGSACGLEKDQLPEPLIQKEDLIQDRIGSGLLNLNPEVSDLPEKLSVEIPIKGNALSEKVGFQKLLVMGTVNNAGGGCACHPNALLKALLSHMVYDIEDWVIVDLEAGVEHLGRGTVEKVDALIVVSEPSARSLDTATEISRLSRDLGLSKQVLAINRGYENLDLPQKFKDILPNDIVVFPIVESLQSVMLESTSVLNLPEKEEIDKVLEELISKLGK